MRSVGRWDKIKYGAGFGGVDGFAGVPLCAGGDLGPAVAVGILGWFMLVSNFDDAKFLTPHEKQYMQDRIQYDGVTIPMNNSFKWKFVVDGLVDWKTWLALFAYIGSLTPLYSIGEWETS